MALPVTSIQRSPFDAVNAPAVNTPAVNAPVTGGGLSSIPVSPTGFVGNQPPVNQPPDPIGDGRSVVLGTPPSLPLPPVTSIERSPFDAVNASPPQGAGNASGGKGSGRTTLPNRGIYSLFSPSYTPTVYNIEDAYTGSDYLDSYIKAAEDSRQSLGDLSRSIQPGSLVEEPVEEVESDEDIRAPKAGAPIEEPEDDDDGHDD
jgi:hypothetical protein